MIKKGFLIALLLVALINSALAFDFYAVCSTGQTLYYNITDANNHYVEMIAPGGVVYSNSNWTGYERPTGIIVLPSNVSYGGTSYSVTSIAGGTFMYCDLVTSITIPNSIKHIGSWAFANTGISTINYPTTAVWLDEFVFVDTPWLDSQPDGLVFLGNTLYCYKGTMPNNYTLTIPSNVNSIAGRAFSWAYEVGYSNLVSVSIPNSVEYIGMYAFYKCHLNTLTLPSSLKVIGSWAFGHNYFTSVTIPTGVVSIGSSAFEQCGSLTTVYFNAQSVTDDQLLLSPFCNCPFLTTISFGNNVHYIPAYLFSGCSSITGSLALPNSLLGIGQYAFQGCTGLIGGVTIPNSTTEIGQMAFYGCTGITSLTIGSNVNTIGTYAFGNMSNLTTINYNAVNCANSNYAFETTITTFNIGSTVQTLPDQLIWNCQNLSSISFPSTLTRIGSMNFYSCGLTGTLILPSSLTDVGYGACNMNMGITSIQINAVIPPTIETMYGIANAFNNGNYDIPVVVPCGSVSAYQNAPGWSYFTNIQETGGCTHQISVLANPSNGGSVQGGGTYNSGANCTVTATPNSNYSFINWTENGSPVSSNTSYSFIVNDDRTLTANFQYQQPSTYTITVSANPNNGGTVSGGGTYQQGQQCTVSASANSNYTFVNWTENGTQVSTNPTYSFTVNSNRTLVAHFQSQPSQYTITLSANPTNGGTVSGGGTYSQGQTCTVTANANPSYSFVSWTENGTQVSTNSTYSFTVTGNRALVANFSYSPTGYVINATAEPSYGGLVSGAGTYNQGQTCTLIATPNPNYDFANWTEGGNVVSTSPSYSFTVNGNRTLVAHFESQVYTINVSSIPSDGGTIYGGGVYSAGITCHLIAVPNNNYSFLNWTENGVVVSSDSDYSFVVTGNRTLVANFVFYDSLEEDAKNDINIYPNPVKDILYMEGVNFDKIEIFNVTGQLLLCQEPSNSTVELNLRHLPSGIYLVKVYWNGGVVCHRLVKE